MFGWFVLELLCCLWFWLLIVLLAVCLSGEFIPFGVCLVLISVCLVSGVVVDFVFVWFLNWLFYCLWLLFALWFWLMFGCDVGCDCWLFSYLDVLLLVFYGVVVYDYFVFVLLVGWVYLDCFVCFRVACGWFGCLVVYWISGRFGLRLVVVWLVVWLCCFVV